MSKKSISILGATGSIGRNTLDVIDDHLDRYSIYALTAHSNVELLLAQAKRYAPQHIVITCANAAENHAQAIKDAALNCNIHYGAEALVDIANAAEVDIVMAAIVGAAGLPPTLAAAKAGKTILLANKEALVMTGQLLIDIALASGAAILPVDSEHNAIFQSLDNYQLGKALPDYGVRRMILTASGGPFRQMPIEQLASVTPEQACAHPNWSMGQKISVDSATMMNKGLEVIEAKWLFNAPLEMIEVLIQPQSIIHSMVEYVDGAVLAELGAPDMRTPIANVLGLPNRLNTKVASLDFTQLGQLDFLPLDEQRFPCLGLAYRALAEGGTASVTLNAANEVAVAAFLANSIAFTDIAKVIAAVMDEIAVVPADNIGTILRIDASAREATKAAIKSNKYYQK